jgi:hypothetical protein
VAADVGLALIAGVGQADDRDLHLEWEDRCAECHGHTGASACERLAVVNGAGDDDADLCHELRRLPRHGRGAAANGRQAAIGWSGRPIADRSTPS